MPDGMTYTVMELAENVGVPRTTINDWLNKFASFIDYSMQGKRRVYSETTLAVLKKIQELRNSGLPIPEIERELTKTCVMHPEADPAPADETAQQKEAAGTPHGPDPENPNNLPELASITREQTEEITRLLGDRLHCILEKMDAMEDKAHKNAIRSWIFFALASILIIILCGTGYFAYLYSVQMTKESNEKNIRLKQLQEQTATLQSGDQHLKEQMDALQKQLPAQREEFQKAMIEMKKAEEQRHQAELALEKDRFAAEQLKYAKERESLSLSVKNKDAELQKKEQILKELKEKAEEQEKLIQQMKKDAERKDKTVLPAASGNTKTSNPEQIKTPAPAVPPVKQ